MEELEGPQRKYLRAQAHHLKPVVQVGKSGVTPGLIGTVSQALDAHELIKIRFIEFKHARRELTDEIARRTDSHAVGLIGNVGILYRQHPDVEKQKIQLP